MSNDPLSARTIASGVIIAVISAYIIAVVAAFFGFGSEQMTPDFRYSLVSRTAAAAIWIIAILIVGGVARLFFNSNGSGFGTWLVNTIVVIGVLVVIIFGIGVVDQAINESDRVIYEQIYGR